MKKKSTLAMRVFVYFSLFLCAGLSFLQGNSAAAVMPQLVRLSPLADVITVPTDVALDRTGQVYITETRNNRITILSQSGQPIGKEITDVVSPISVAVDAGGRIFAGGLGSGSVAVYGADLAFLFKLGAGDGEFVEPADIAVDSNGKIYVVDTQKNSVSIYDSQGKVVGSIGTPSSDGGLTDGQLHHPASIAIDANAAEIIILDRKQVYDTSSAKMTDGARIQYFDMNGALLRAYDKFGFNNTGTTDAAGNTVYDVSMGKLHRPQRLAVDGAGRVYVTDVTMQNIMVYDTHDTFLGAVNNVTKLPRGIAIDTANRLYVASLGSESVEIFGADSYTALSVTPTVMQFSVVQNGSQPSAQVASIGNEGTAAFTRTASTTNSWITFGAVTTGTLQANDTASLEVAVATAGLTPGSYTGNVRVDTGAGAAEDITVILNVEPSTFQVTPASLNFQTVADTTPAGQSLDITSGTSSAWTASADQSWITLSRTGGTTPGTLGVYADTASLTPGTHNGTITFVQTGSSLAATLVPVSITITENTTPTETTPPPTMASGDVKWDRSWTTSQHIPGTTLIGVAGTSGADIFAVGDNGSILHFNGRDWTPMNSTVTTSLNSVWLSSATNGYAVGAEGQVLSYNGTAWTPAAAAPQELQDIWGSSAANVVTAGSFGTILNSSFTGTAELGTALRSVTGRSESDIYAAGEAGAVHRYDGRDWTPMTTGTDQWLNGIWTAPSADLYAVGENGTIIRYAGSSWTTMSSGTTRSLNGVCGFAADNIYAVGSKGLMLHYDGSGWSAAELDTQTDLNDVWCSEQGDIVAVGDDGTIIRGTVKKKFNWLPIIQLITANASKAVK